MVELDFTKIIRSIKNWLGFFSFVVLILYLILLEKAQITEKVSLFLAGLLGLSILSVFVLSFVLQEKTIRVNVLFPLKIEEVDRLEFKKQELKIRDKKGTHTCKLNLYQNFGGAMTFELNENVERSGSISLELIDSNNRTWKTQSINPYNIVCEPYIAKEKSP